MSELVTVLIGESLTEVIVPVKSLSILTNILEDSKVVSRFFVYHNQHLAAAFDALFSS